MKRATLLAMAIAMSSVPAAEAGGERANTKVTLDFIQSTPGGTIYTGDIFSPRRACKDERRVIVYRVRGGADEKRGSTLSYKGSDQPGFYWAFEEDGIPPKANYYAKVRRTDRCNGDRSPLYP